MPMSPLFQRRLFPYLPQILGRFETPFHIYDEEGIFEGGNKLKDAFSWYRGFRELFAVKALPNRATLDRLHRRLGFGFDCSSTPELRLVREIGAKPSEIMFTSNNTDVPEYDVALADGGCILNLDDITFVPKVPVMPRLICFRYNPGERRNTSNQIIGNPKEAKYGVRHDQIVDAYRQAIARGARRFGLHTMIVSNERDYRFMVETVKMLLEVVEMVSDELDVRFEFINIGGGIGIPYRPEHEPFNLEAFSIEARKLFTDFKERFGYMPKLYMESGRAITGPHGVLVAKCINRMSKYVEVAGLDASMPDLMRPGMYGSEGESSQHQITVLDPMGRIKTGPLRKIKVVGSLCEGNDVFAFRMLPDIEEGDIVIIHDTGAHGHAMGFWYNARLRHAEFLLRADKSVLLIRRADTYEDYVRTMHVKRTTLRLA